MMAIQSAVAVALLGSTLMTPVTALGAGPTTPARPNQQALTMLNPQPEVPSKPAAAGGRSVKAPLKVEPHPSDTMNPKALNPQPEVPSKPGKKLPKKKPIAKS